MRWPWRSRRRLAEEAWEPVTAHHMELAFLRGEFHEISNPSDADRRLLDTPDLTDSSQNRRRHELLSSKDYCRRFPLLELIPPSTEWFEVHALQAAHLHELRVIAHGVWLCLSAHRNEVSEVAALCRSRGKFPDDRPLRMETDPGSWAAPILWGRSEQGPFTILEGNHRLVAYAALRWLSQPSLNIATCVGLSRSDPCHWHFQDRFPD